MLESLKDVSNQFEICISIADIEDPNHPLIFVNENFTKTTGYLPLEALGKNCRFLQGKLTDEKKILFMRESFKNNYACCVDLVNYRKNGEPFWNRLVMFPFKANGKRYFVGLQNDITQKKKQINSEKDLEFVQNSEICHKINNPLTQLLLYNSNLKQQDLNPEKKDDIKIKLKEAILRIENFVVNLEDQSEFENWKY
jgi:PAS domain S-box-containing protein